MGLKLWTEADGQPDPTKTYFLHRGSGFGPSRTAVFEIEPAEFHKRYAEYLSGGKMIQDAFPELNDDEREFMLTGITPAEWDVLFNDRDED